MSPQLPGPEVVADLSARPLRGQLYRIVPRHLQGRALSTEGSVLYGGRYNRKGVFGALYFSESPALSRAEVRKAAAGRRVREAGLETLLVPSAAAPGANLVLSPTVWTPSRLSSS